MDMFSDRSAEHFGRKKNDRPPAGRMPIQLAEELIQEIASVSPTVLKPVWLQITVPAETVGKRHRPVGNTFAL